MASRWVRAVLWTVLVGAFGCSSDGGPGGGNGDVSFEGKIEPLQKLAFDTGYLPAASPIQVRFETSGGGALVVVARGHAGADGPLDAVAGSGQLSVDLSLKAKASLKVALPGASFEGPIDGAPDIDIAIKNSVTFEPFLVGGTPAALDAKLAPTEVARIPLAGALSAIPGAKGDLVVTASADLSASYAGTCAKAAGGVAQATGRVTVGGTVTLEPRVEIKIPLVGEKTLDAFPIKIALPPVDSALDLGSRDIASGDVVTTAGPCTGGSSAGDGGAASSDSGAGPRHDGGAGPHRDGPVTPHNDASAPSRDASGDRSTPTCTVGTPDNCGACGDQCPGLDNSASSRTCSSGVCGLTCRGDNYDVNGDPSDGCEVLDSDASYDSALHARDLGKVDDCAGPNNVTMMIPSDDRPHDSVPAQRAMASKWLKLHITDNPLLTCSLKPKVTIDLWGMPANAAYTLVATFTCDGNARAFTARASGKGGDVLVATPATDCSALGLGDDSGMLMVEIRKTSAAGHSANIVSVKIEQ